jgi:hypothetical protein
VRLINHSQVPDAKLKQMFDLCAKPLGISAMKVNVYGSKSYNGFLGQSDIYNNEIEIAVGGNGVYPYQMKREKRLINPRDRWMWDEGSKQFKINPDFVYRYRENPHLQMLFLSHDEFLVHLFGHELRHQWQRKKRPMAQYTFTVRKLGSRSYFRRERDADAYALKMVRQWRRLHAVDIYSEHPDNDSR